MSSTPIVNILIKINDIITFTHRSLSMKAITMKKTGMTNPARVGFVSFSSNTTEIGDYLRKVNSIKSLDLKEEKELALRAKNGDLFAKKELVQANLKLVLTIARKAIHVSKLPLTDLIQEGNLGLMIAVEKFNPELGYRFSTYATWWIKFFYSNH